MHLGLFVHSGWVVGIWQPRGGNTCLVPMGPVALRFHGASDLNNPGQLLFCGPHFRDGCVPSGQVFGEKKEFHCLNAAAVRAWCNMTHAGNRTSRNPGVARRPRLTKTENYSYNNYNFCKANCIGRYILITRRRGNLQIMPAGMPWHLVMRVLFCFYTHINNRWKLQLLNPTARA